MPWEYALIYMLHACVSKHCSEMQYLQPGEVKVKVSVFPLGSNVVLIPGLGFSTQKQCAAVNIKHLSS